MARQSGRNGHSGAYTALTSMGSCAAAALLGESVLIEILAAGVGSYAAHVALTRGPSLRGVALPHVVQGNGKLYLLGFSDQVLLAKLEHDFKSSPLSQNQLVMAAYQDLLRKGQRFGSVGQDAEACLDLLSMYPMCLPRHGWQDHPALQRVRRSDRPISVLSLHLHPAMLATFVDMRDRVGIPIMLESDAENGVQAIRLIKDRLKRGRPYDLTLLPSAVYYRDLLDDPELLEYSSLAPVCWQTQYIICREYDTMHTGLRFVERLWYPDRGSAEEQMRSMHDEGHSFPVEVPYASAGDFDLLSLQDNEGAVMWAPRHEEALRHPGFSAVSPYTLWMCLYSLNERFRSEAQRRDLLIAFLNSWMFCSHHLEYATMLVLRDQLARAKFRRGLVAGIGRH